MTYFVTNWKTTLLGAGGLFTALGSLLTDLASGNIDHLGGYLSAIIVAIGLLFAKDGNVSGGK